MKWHRKTISDFPNPLCDNVTIAKQIYNPFIITQAIQTSHGWHERGTYPQYPSHNLVLIVTQIALTTKNFNGNYDRFRWTARCEFVDSLIATKTNVDSFACLQTQCPPSLRFGCVVRLHSVTGGRFFLSRSVICSCCHLKQKQIV